MPRGVELVAAAKGRRPEEVREVVEAGVSIVGENYVQEAESARRAVELACRDQRNSGAVDFTPHPNPLPQGERELTYYAVKWHFIGHLQRNKVKKAVSLFDMIQTVDSAAIAREIDEHCTEIGKTMPVLIEVNSGREPQKAGVLPEDVESLAREISRLANIKLMGLMTMGPSLGIDDSRFRIQDSRTPDGSGRFPDRFAPPPIAREGEEMRPYFAVTRKTFDSIGQLSLPNTEMRYLSMGMSHSYTVAIEEGANMIRLGRQIFGER